MKRQLDEDFEHFLRLYLEWRDELYRYFVLLAPRERAARKLYARTWLHLAKRMRRGSLTERNGFPVSLFRIAHRCARSYWKRHYATVETRERMRDVELALLFDRLQLDVQAVAPVLGVKPVRLMRYVGKDAAIDRRQRVALEPRAKHDVAPDPPNRRRNGRSEWPDPRLEWWLLEQARRVIAGRSVQRQGRSRSSATAMPLPARAWRWATARLSWLSASAARPGAGLREPWRQTGPTCRVLASMTGEALRRWRQRPPADDLVPTAGTGPWPWAIAGSSLAAAVTAVILMLQATEQPPGAVPSVADVESRPTGMVAPAPDRHAPVAQAVRESAAPVPATREAVSRVQSTVAGASTPSGGGETGLADNTPPGYETWEPHFVPGYGPMHQNARDPATGMTVMELERAVEYYFAEGQVDHALQYLQLLERLRSAQPPMPN